jgi:hypothetical protein
MEATVLIEAHDNPSGENDIDESFGRFLCLLLGDSFETRAHGFW